MTLVPGSRLGAYEILSLLGAGGMGEVYRATDTVLKRQVALKILAPEVAGNSERIARFQREAEVLAALNHPNIAHLYGIESSNGTLALVMELVEGETLADRIARGPIPLDEALPLATQIAHALEAAHEHGIIHRDLKPANIKVRHDGAAKVLDFGLAKALEPTVSRQPGGVLTNSPTMTSPVLATGLGVLLGTAAYMSPEQAKGRQADRRSDIWAFGCILFEMLTGQQAFVGDSISEVLAAVLTAEPDWRELPGAVTPGLQRTIRRCMRKDPGSRLQAIGDVRLELEELGSEPVVEATRMRPTISGQVLSAVSGIALGSVATALIVSGLSGRTTQSIRTVRLQVTPTGTAAVATSGLDNDVAITPDGSRIVYVGDHGRQLFVRATDALEPKAIATGELRAPFVSPDGQWVGFLADGQTIRKVPISGGPASTVINVIGGLRGAAWTPRGTIVFAGLDSTGLQEVSVDGGSPEVLTRPDQTHNEQNHWWPEALPDGNSILLTIVPTGSHMEAAQIGLLDRRTKRWKVLIRGGTNAHYDPRGYLIYGAAGTVYGVRFDLARGEVLGAPIALIQGVAISALGAMNVGAARDGTLVYVPATSVTASRTLVWIDRQGQRSPVALPPRMYIYPRVSPDGSRIVISSQDEDYDLWSWDLAKSTLTRLTFEAGQDSFPAWTPDGKRVAFVSTRSGGQRLYAQAADGTGVAELLAASIGGNVSAITPDGRWVLFARNQPSTGFDIMRVSLESDHRLETVIQTPANERNAEVSPNGKWLAYQSDESGRYEVYVRPFPGVDAGRWQISYTGGTRPLWGPGGHELFYLAGDTLTQIDVADGPTWAAGSPRQLFQAQSHVAAFAGRSYDIMPDGKRFVAVDDVSDGESQPISLVVVEGWNAAISGGFRTPE